MSKHHHPDYIEQIQEFYGPDVRTSDWFTVNQSLINKFGESTSDTDWLHTDPARAAKESPFGGTIAFGFWTISMLTFFARQISGRDYPEGALYGLNYGFDRIRLMSPTPVGSRIRCHVNLEDVVKRDEGQYLVHTNNVIEIENVEKPALVADWLFLLVYPTAKA